MKTAKEMYDFCKEKKFGQGQNEKWGLKHFALVENALAEDENVVMSFIGLHNYISATNHNNNFAYAITEKRIIMAQKKLIGEIQQSVFLDNINDITFTSGMIWGVITIDTIKETFNVGLDKAQAANINAEIHDILHKLKNKKDVPTLSVTTTDPIEELKKYKELSDIGVITQEEFDEKKKQLLNL